jgi:hypothetical protein
MIFEICAKIAQAAEASAIWHIFQISRVVLIINCTTCPCDYLFIICIAYVLIISMFCYVRTGFTFLDISVHHIIIIKFVTDTCIHNMLQENVHMTGMRDRTFVPTNTPPLCLIFVFLVFLEYIVLFTVITHKTD